MRLIGHKFWDNVWLMRVILFLMGLGLVLGGLRALLGDRLHYRNYWGGIVFAPLGVALGAALLLLLVLKWNRLSEREPELKGRAARKAAQARNARPAVETFNDPWTGRSA
jgi:hypothetical protein